MILLTIIAVGLLTLSATTLRSASQGEAMAAARNHARLALMLAIGDLQKTTGQDRAVTVPGSMVDQTHPHGVTAVWRPWNEGMSPDGRNSSVRQDRFRQWLLSTPDGTEPVKRSDLPLAKPGPADVVPLLADGSLGDRGKKNPGEDQRIHLRSTRLNNGRASGGFAWAVIDESTKARLDLYEKEPKAKHAALTRAGAPPVDGVTALAGLDKLLPDEKTSPLLVTMRNAELQGGTDPLTLRAYSPDLTVHAASLMTDVVAGGLKKNLSVWFSKGLTSTERTTKLYRSANVVASNIPSDPPLSLLESYHQYYKNFGRRSGLATPRPDGVAAKLPSRYTPIRSDQPVPATPSEPVMVPTVLRVDVVFSLITRDVHGGRSQKLKDASRPYMLHLLYLPVVTLHNPYNVPLSVEGLKITFKNIPIAFQFLVDGQPVTNSLVPLNQLYSNSEGGTGATKDFSCTLTSMASSSSASSPFELKPGQTKIFGTPKVSPDWTWANEQPGVGQDGVALFDWRNNQTADFNLAPKLMTDPKTGAGFDIDWLAPRTLQTEVGKACGNGEGIVALRGTERIGVNFGPFAPPAGNGSFNVTIQLKQSGAFLDAGCFSLRYGTADRLKTIFEQGVSLRFPTKRTFPETFPKVPADKPFTVADIHEANSTKIKDYLKPRPFVIFSLGARTTKESFVPSRTIADGNPVMNLAKIDLSTDRSDPVGGAPLEMVMMPIRNGNAAIEDLRDTEEGYAFGGNGALHGTPRATLYELPRAPLQSLAQFRHANLSGSGFMPMTTYTAGESRAHPLIGTDKVDGAWTDRSMMLDHTWMANEALWDRYFLSTIADQPAISFSKTKSYKDVMAEFFALTSRLPNQRFSPVNPGSTKVPPVLDGASAPQDAVAANLLLEGGFNVNSTSEDAWVAVLSGLREAEIETNAGIDSGSTGRTAVLRVRRPTDKNIDRQAINIRANRWEGYRSLTDQEIRSLAKEIVVEVRKRGPFLSVADFVNRGIGSDGDEINLKGALQAAIDRLNFNQQAHFDGIELDAAQLNSHGYKSVKAGSGNSATAAPGAITQGDLLSSIGSRITVRSDTFRIRAYGESHPSTATWGQMTNYIWDSNLGSRDDQSKTRNMNSGAGWDYRSGFIVDWLIPNASAPAADSTRKDNNQTMGVFGVRPNDTVNVEVMPMMPGAANGKFAVEFQAKVAGRDTPLGIYEYNYGNEQKLRQVLENGNHTTSGKITFPFRRERDFTVSELTLANPDNTPIRNWGSAPKQFAIFTLGARTAHDTLYPGKPGRTTSFVHHVLQQDATRAHPALLPMEMSLLPITGSGANTVGSIDADDVDRAFYFSGTSRGTGAIHYVSQNIPTAPLMNLADFRHANLAGSGHLPLVQHTVGESLASPMVPPDKTRSSSPFGYEVVDHAWYSNQTLWDGYFFSGIRNQSDASLLFANRPMPLNPRLTPLPGSGMDATKAAQFALSDTAWSDLASMLAIKGGFNVNSTSKHAWKAVLSSLSGLDFPVLGPIEIRDPAVNPTSYREKIVTAQDAAFPRLSRPISDRVDANNSFDNQRRWSGFRELSDKEIDTLAETIVAEVRSRGPFLSMAEFVNRRASSGTDDLSARGLLEEAIRKSKLNEIRMGAANRVIDEAEAASFGYANPKAAAGNTEEGASAFISQGDLLSAIGASITVRSDTFVVRAYGAAREGNRITASTWCEAVVQRLPSFVDPTDAATKVQAASLQAGRTVNDLTKVNQRFGRRFEIVSFRWLTVDEV